MNLGDIARALYRRWIVSVPVLVLTAIAVVVVVSTADTTYEATATLLLAEPEIVGSSDEDPDEPAQATPLSPTAIAEIAEGDRVRSRVIPEGSDADYSITPRDNRILRIEATSQDEAIVVTTANQVIDEIVDILGEMDSAESSTNLEGEILARPTRARQRLVAIGAGETAVEYYASGSVLVSIEQEAVVSQANPYAASGGTLRVIEEVASTESVKESVLASVEGADYVIAFTPRDLAPIMRVTATAPQPETTLDALDAALGFLDDELAGRQEITGAEPATWLRWQRLDIPNEPEEVSPNLRRPVATIVVLGLVGAASLAVLAESVVTYRNKGAHAGRTELESVGPFPVQEAQIEESNVPGSR